MPETERSAIEQSEPQKKNYLTRYVENQLKGLVLRKYFLPKQSTTMGLL